MVGWYLPVQVVEEKKLNMGGVRVVVIMRRVAVGRTAGGFGQAVGVRSRREPEWHRHKMSRKQLVGIPGQRVQADGGREVLAGWRARRSGKSGWGKQWRTQSGGGRPRGNGGQWNRQQ